MMITAAPPTNQTSDIALPNIILTGGSSALSIVGALVIFCSYSFIPPEKNFTRKLLMYLTVADFVTAFGNMVGMVRYVTLYGTGPRVQNCSGHVKTEEEWLCKTQSFLTTASNMSSFLWTLVIAVHLWASVVLQSDKTKSRLARFIYHVLCWAVPVAVVASIFGSLGEDYCFGTGVWCGIRSDLPHHEVEMLMYIADIAWQLFSYIASCFLLVLSYFT
ncbi:GP157-like protein [Mya arenaria]|uniref:GP157-like protein n=1 Tax=Mya arenaria TaxID=6604 RepID=A0ABY7FKL4_MYAAR|nr:G-protein coupled receptor 157-like [Mya arenaria]WAR21218.1 GP157-like protein [Mya arenaria]